MASIVGAKLEDGRIAMLNKDGVFASLGTPNEKGFNFVFTSLSGEEVDLDLSPVDVQKMSAKLGTTLD